MSRALLILVNDAIRERAASWARTAPNGTRVEFKRPRRSLEQNDLMWAMLTDVAGQLTWHGKRLAPDQWKLVFLSGLRKELTVIPNFNGDGFIPLGYSSSDLSVGEMSNMIELIYAYGAEHGAVFKAAERRAA